MQNQQPLLIVMIGGEQRIQEGLRILLASLPQKPQVVIKRNSADGIALLKTCTPDLVVLNIDTQSAPVDGLFAAIAACSHHIPLIALVDSLEQMTQASQCGADSVLLRGFSSQDLFSVINTLLSRPKKIPPSESFSSGDFKIEDPKLCNDKEKT